MARPNALRRKAAAGQTCIGPIFQEFWSPGLFAFCGVDGFDGCFIGHGDMSLVMGREYYGGPTMHPEIKKLVDRSIELTLGAGKLAMIVAPTGAEARAFAARGVQLITLNFGALVRRGI